MNKNNNKLLSRGTYEYSKLINFNDIEDPKERAKFFLREKHRLGRCLFCNTISIEKTRLVVCHDCSLKAKALFNWDSKTWIFKEYEKSNIIY